MAPWEVGQDPPTLGPRVDPDGLGGGWILGRGWILMAWTSQGWILMDPPRWVDPEALGGGWIHPPPKPWEVGQDPDGFPRSGSILKAW